MNILSTIFYLDALSLVLTGLVGFVVLCVASFSKRYLAGDRKKKFFYLNLGLLTAAVFTMAIADHLVLFLISWIVSCCVLTRMMMHKKEWSAAVASSRLALYNFLTGFLLMASAFCILFLETGSTSIQEIINTEISTSSIFISGLLIFLAAMTQCGLWPFHRWLTSSLNSPTPVSAVMHAGLVNGGGFILARFAPLYLGEVTLLNIIFITGIITAILGTLWKLMQSDVKRMLACSTMGQMGFMIAQCGLGLFPAAIAHMCWHGLFKAYLFLGSGTAAQEKRFETGKPPKIKEFLLALLCGTASAYAFALIGQKDIFAGDTTLFLIAIALIAGTQFALPLIKQSSMKKIPVYIGATVIMGGIYATSINLIQFLMQSVNIRSPLELNIFHLLALTALTAAWLMIVFKKPKRSSEKLPEWKAKLYVQMLNESQPHPQTITANRNKYQL